jgi:hypothetical protein
VVGLELTEDVDRNFEIYCEILKVITNTHILLKTIRMYVSKPIWMTKDYWKIVKAVSSCKSIATIRNQIENWAAFKQIRKKCENLKRKLKLQSLNRTSVNRTINRRVHGKCLIEKLENWSQIVLLSLCRFLSFKNKNNRSWDHAVTTILAYLRVTAFNWHVRNV